MMWFTQPLITEVMSNDNDDATTIAYSVSTQSRTSPVPELTRQPAIGRNYTITRPGGFICVISIDEISGELSSNSISFLSHEISAILEEPEDTNFSLDYK